MKLSDRCVLSVDCPQGRKDRLVFDDTLPGFGLRVTAGGARRFIFQYRTGEGAKTVRRVVLGEFGAELTTAQARKKAEALRGQVRDARDPVAERRESAREAQRLERAAAAERAAATFTVDRLIQDWTEQHLIDRSASYAARTPVDLRAALAGSLRASASAFAQSDALAALDAAKAERGPVAANRLRAVGRACWGWAVRRGVLSSNPWEATPRPAREDARSRVLTDVELATIWHGADALGAPWAGIVKMAVLTGQRRGEIAGMNWSELDLDAGSWSLPGSRTKNRRGHDVPLSLAALLILRGVRRRRAATLVFEGARRTVPSGFGKVKNRLDDVLKVAAKQARRTHAHWTLHDIRRTVATGLQRLGVRLEVTEAILNHVSGTRAGIVGVYQRHGWDREKKEALEAWANYVQALPAPTVPDTRDLAPAIA